MLDLHRFLSVSGCSKIQYLLCNIMQSMQFPFFDFFITSQMLAIHFDHHHKLLLVTALMPN